MFFLLLFQYHRLCETLTSIIRTTTATRKPRTHQPEHSPSLYRRNLTGGLNRAPGSAHSMEFLRGIYAFMQVSRSSVSNTFLSNIFFLSLWAILYKFHFWSVRSDFSFGSINFHNQCILNLILCFVLVDLEHTSFSPFTLP